MPLGEIKRITCFPEGLAWPRPCEPNCGSQPHGKLPLGSGVHAPGPASGRLRPALGPAALPDAGDCPRSRGVFDKLALGSRYARQLGAPAIAFYALMKNRKLNARRRDRRTEAASPRPERALRGRRDGRHRGQSPARPGRGGPAAASRSHSPAPARWPRLAPASFQRSGVPRSPGWPARPEWSRAGGAAGTGQEGP